jgi:hypothetical protein
VSVVEQVKAAGADAGEWYQDAFLMDKLVALLVHDHRTLEQVSALLEADDFKPVRGVPNGRSRWLVAERALEHWEKHHEPLGGLLRADVLEYAASLNMAASSVTELREYVKALAVIKLNAPDAVTEKVMRFKTQRLQADAIDELSELQASGQLTIEKWDEISARVHVVKNGSLSTVNYRDTMADRNARRAAWALRPHVPMSLIWPLDALGGGRSPLVGPKQLGMVLAPWKRGKSTFMRWLACAFVLQKLNVLYVTLEDTRDIVEDSLDSIVTSVPLKSLADKPNTAARRFARYRAMVKSRIEIFDGVGEEVTVSMLGRIVDMKRRDGFIPDVIMTDMDDKIAPSRVFRERRDASEDVYVSYQRLIGRERLIGWLSAQTQRDTRGMKILSGDRIAEDIGKIRKVHACVSMGKGDWTDDSIYLWIAAHRTQPQERGCTIVPDLTRSLIYDHEATQKAAQIHPDES